MWKSVKIFQKVMYKSVYSFSPELSNLAFCIEFYKLLIRYLPLYNFIKHGYTEFN
jgi:hypothetical protein